MTLSTIRRPRENVRNQVIARRARIWFSVSITKILRWW
jgi:hypothetical protein